MPNYVHLDGVIRQDFILSEQYTLVIAAKDVRRERTGVHASVDLRAVDSAKKDTLLSWSTFNVGREADRKSLALAAIKHLPDTYRDFPLKHHLDDFCIGLWDESLKRFAPEEMGGAEHIEPPTYLLYPYIIQGGGTILFGPPGRGKSQTLLLMAQSVHKAVNKLWQTSFANNVLLINLERSGPSIAQRLARINLYLGLPQTERLWTINARGKSLLAVEQAAKRFVKDHSVDFVILDSISRSGFGSLKEDEDMNACMDCLNAICPTWLAAAHSPRADESHAFGSVMFDAAADLMVQLGSEIADDKSTLGIKLKITKANDGGAMGYTETLAYEFDDTGFTQARAARNYEFPALNATAKLSPMDEIKAVIDEKGPQSATQLSKTLKVSVSYIARLLRDNPEFTCSAGAHNEKTYDLLV